MASSQINDSLNFLSNQVRTVRDTSESTYPLVFRSCNYGFKILDDTLQIEYSEESKYKTNDSENIQYSNRIYTANLRDISEINVLNEIIGSEYAKYESSFFEIHALRSYGLFKVKNLEANVETETDLISIPIFRLKDTTNFRKIGSLIKNYGNIKDNYIDPSCEFQEIKLGNLKNNSFLAMFENGLEDSIKLNRNCQLNDELSKVLMSYLELENIKKFYGTIVLNANDSIEFISSYQNDMYNFYNSLDSLSMGQEAMREIAYLKITNEQLNEITTLLSKQNWETGKCNGVKVNSYFDFHLENKSYIKSG